MPEEQATEAELPKRPRCCMGAAYWSLSRAGAQQPPVCAGLSTRLKPTDDTAQLPTDSVPGGDFKYVCLGYSAWDEATLKRAAVRSSGGSGGSGSSSGSDEAVSLPFCQGLEVVSAAAVNRRPELMEAAAGGAGVGASSASSDGGGGVRQRPGRTFVPGAAGVGGTSRLPEVPTAADWERFKERFVRISGKMVEKMGANLGYMAATTRRSWQQIMRELGGGGGGGDKAR